MSRKIMERPAVAVARLRQPGLHFVGGVPGLALQVTATGARSWILRTTIDGKRRDMGLGSYPDVSLAIARQAARDARAKISGGRDPIEEGRAARAALAEARAAALTFERAATLYVEAQEAGWRGTKHAVQWRTVMEAYAYPVIGAMHVDAVKLPHVMQVLEPIWRSKTQTASRLRGHTSKSFALPPLRSSHRAEHSAHFYRHDARLPVVLERVRSQSTRVHGPNLHVSNRHAPMADAGAVRGRLRSSICVHRVSQSCVHFGRTLRRSSNLARA